jgi:hypothetical protein
MSHHGVSTWPPGWKATWRSKDELPKGEVGILKEVFMTDDSDRELLLTIEFQGNRYFGGLEFVDPWFCSQVYGLLQHHIGRTIKEVGDMELAD